MTARMYYDSDADPRALAGQRIAILGFGSQGHAHALNLKDSGLDVLVGLQPASKSRSAATEAGLMVLTPAEAVKLADLVLGLVPDPSQADLDVKDFAPNPKHGPRLMSAPASKLTFNKIQPPPP